MSPSTDRHAVLRATPARRSVRPQPSFMSAFVGESVCVSSQCGSQFSVFALSRHNQELSRYDNEEILWFGPSAVFRGCVYTCRMHVSLQYMMGIDSGWPLFDKWSGFTVWLYYIILQSSASSDCCNVLSFSPFEDHKLHFSWESAAEESGEDKLQEGSSFFKGHLCTAISEC